MCVATQLLVLLNAIYYSVFPSGPREPCPHYFLRQYMVQLNLNLTKHVCDMYST